MLGTAHTGNLSKTKDELAILKQLKDTLDKQKDGYKAKEVAIQIKAGEAWLQLEQGNTKNALLEARLAADMEDSTEKHPVTPGEVLPARELLGDMMMETKQYKAALEAYEAVLTKSPNRFNAVYNAGIAAEKSGGEPKAIFYFKQLIAIADTTNSNRPEIGIAQSFVKAK